MSNTREIQNPQDDLFLAETAAAIRALRDKVKHDLIEVGQRLIIAKDRVGHGRFLAWLKQEFAWSEDTAERFMQVARTFGSDSARPAESHGRTAPSESLTVLFLILVVVAAILILTYGGLASGFSKARVAMSCCQEGKTT
jgi:hypothetical protein